MKSPLFTVRHNSFNTRGFPWIDRIVKGLEYHDESCSECGGGPVSKVVGDIHAKLDPNKGQKWPDVLGCGASSVLIVSERVLNDWKTDGIGDVPVGGRVVVVSPLPKRLQGVQPPCYVWLDPAKMIDARLDEEASGFVGVLCCSICGRRTWDIAATYERQHSPQWGGYVLRDWYGANLFTAASYGFHFCTEKVIECAKRHRHTNFRFVPVEDGIAAGSSGLKYLLPNPPIS